MNAKQFKLHSKSILILVERISNDRDGNPRYDVSILSDFDRGDGVFQQWNPKLLGLKRLKSNKYRINGWYADIDELIAQFFAKLQVWYDAKSNTRN